MFAGVNMGLKEQTKTDFLEVAMIIGILLLIIVIYVPIAIWEEERYYEKKADSEWGIYMT